MRQVGGWAGGQVATGERRKKNRQEDSRTYYASDEERRVYRIDQWPVL
jgi:hypothetical protein